MLKTELIFIIKNLPRLILGLLLCSVAILLTIYASLGVAPWDVFHIGVVNHSSLTIGQVSQLTGLLVILISLLVGVIPGIGSVLNFYLVGIFIDAIHNSNLIFIPETLVGRFLMLSIGIWLFGWGSFFYIGSCLGAGPRDGLMLGLVKKYKKSVYLIRTIIEVAVLILGIVLGGPFGIGTIIISLTIGYSVQSAFTIGKYNLQNVRQRDLMDLVRAYKYDHKKELDI